MSFSTLFTVSMIIQLLRPPVRLEYHIPVNGSVFLNTNISYASNATYLNQFAGSLLVTVNDDASVPDGVVSVTMHTTSQQLTNSTHVCMMETGSGGGLYIFVRFMFFTMWRK